MPDVFRINDTIFSWESCVFTCAGQPFQGLVSLDLEETREVKLVYGARRDGRPIGRTSGKYSVSGLSMKMLRDSAYQLMASLSVLGLGSFGDAEWPLIVQAVEPVPGALPMTLGIESVRITKVKDAHEEGIDELLTEFEMSAMQATRNGMRLWSVVRSVP